MLHGSCLFMPMYMQETRRLTSTAQTGITNHDPESSIRSQKLSIHPCLKAYARAQGHGSAAYDGPISMSCTTSIKYCRGVRRVSPSDPEAQRVKSQQFTGWVFFFPSDPIRYDVPKLLIWMSCPRIRRSRERSPKNPRWSQVYSKESRSSGYIACYLYAQLE